MPRRARVCVPGYPLHITQRGHNGNACFLEDGGFQLYLEFLDEARTKADCHVHAFVLMSNHVHLIAVPRTPEALPLTLKQTHGRYAAYFNTRRASNGHVWQGRYYSCALDEGHLWTAQE